VNILLVVHCFFPDHFYGTEAYTLELAKSYVAMGHRVTVLSAIFQGEKSSNTDIFRYEYQGIPVVCIDKNQMPHSSIKETYFQPELHAVLERVLREISPDLVHVNHLLNHTAALLDVTLKLAIPTYATFTDFFGFCLNNKLEAADGGLCGGPSLTRDNCVACHLKAFSTDPGAPRWAHRSSDSAIAMKVGTSLVEAHGLPPMQGGPWDTMTKDICDRPHTLVPRYNATYRAAIAPTRFLLGAYEQNGVIVPMRPVHFGIDIDRRKKSVRGQNHKSVIGFIGQMAPHKGIDLLVEAFGRLSPGSAVLHVWGAMEQHSEFGRKVSSLADGIEVEFKGTFDKADTASVLDSMDLLVIPSRWYENSPLVLLSALATHTPVLVADVAGMTEFVEPGINGQWFERGNCDSLYERLEALVARNDELAALSATTHYLRTPAVMAEDTFAMYGA
jgi:glycosyltransferase involved in cell wall biosynthesis